MLNRSSIFLGLMLTGTLATAALVSREESAGNEVVAADNHSASTNAGTPERKQSQQLLQLGRLVRSKTAQPDKDPFAGKTWYVPPPPPPPPPAPPAPIVQEVIRPSAPPLPFSYMGRMVEDDGHVVVYLAQGSRALSVSIGDTIDNIYHIDSLSSGQLVLTYLPLGIRQTLNIPAGTLTSSLGAMASEGTGAEETPQSLQERVQVQGVEVRP